jgi:hypothetical protein
MMMINGHKIKPFADLEGANLRDANLQGTILENKEPQDIISLSQKIKEIEVKLQNLVQEKYEALLLDIKRLEEENIGMSNELYELQNKLEILQEPRWQHLDKFTLGE